MCVAIIDEKLFSGMEQRTFGILFMPMSKHDRCNTNIVELVPSLVFDNMWLKTCSQPIATDSCHFRQHSPSTHCANSSRHNS